MTENKQFQYNVNKNIIEQDGKFVAYMNCVDGVRIANKLNVFQKENEQLKKENLDLSEELDYYKSKCASLETGLFQADRETEQLRKENKELQGKASSWKITASEQIMEQSRLMKENVQLKHKLKSLNDNFNHLKRLFDEIEEPISDELLAEYSRIVMEDFE